MALTSQNIAQTEMGESQKGVEVSRFPWVKGALASLLIGASTHAALGETKKEIQTADASQLITPVSVTDAPNTISLFEEGETPTMPSRDFLYSFFPDISQDTLDAFYDAWESLPEDHKNNVENLFINALPSAQKAMILNFEKARTGELKLDQRNLASLAMLISQINDLVVFNETGAFPASGQLPDALAQLERMTKGSPVFSEMFRGDFEAQVTQIQDTAYTKYDAIIAEYDATIAEENAKQAEGLSIIVEENAKQAEENAKQAQLRQANETLGLLLNI